MKNNIIKQVELKSFFCTWEKIATATAITFISYILLLLLGPFGIVLSFILYSLLSVGLAKLSINLLVGRNTGFKDLIHNYKLLPKIVLLILTKLVYVLFSSIFFIVPGIICFFNYCFTPFILAEKQNLEIEKILESSKTQTYGIRHKLFIDILICFLFFISSVILGTTICIAINYLIPMHLAVKCFIVLSIVTITFLCLIYPFWYYELTLLYLQTKSSFNKNNN